MRLSKITRFEPELLEQLWKNCKATLPVMIAIGSLGCVGLAAEGASAFDVASIKQSPPGNQPVRCDTLPGGRFVCHNVRAEFLLKLAAGARIVTIKGAPSWLDDLYDLDAEAEGAGEMTQAELAPAMLALFRDRFGLVTHEETVQQTVYFLEQQGSRAKLKPSAPGTKYSLKRSDENVLLKGETMAHFAGMMAGRPDVNATVIDNTGLAGKFDFTFPYVSAGGNGNAPTDTTVTPEVAMRTAASYSSTFDALISLGLRLRPEKRDGIALIIDQIHRPTEN